MDKLVDFVTEFTVEQVKELAKEGKAQRLLLACFEKYIEEEAKNERRENNCCLDKEAILSLDINKISPNLEAEQIRENLKSLFEKCIRTDDDELEVEKLEAELKSIKSQQAQYELDTELKKIELYNKRMELSEKENQIKKEILSKNISQNNIDITGISHIIYGNIPTQINNSLLQYNY